MTHLMRFTPILVGLALLFTPGTASAAEPRIDELQPQGVRRGGEATVKLVGPRLGAEPQEVVLYGPGVTVTKLEPVDGNSVQATLSIAPDCPIGRHAVRLRTSTGLSNLETLHVGALEAVDEVEPNNTLEAAQAVPLDRTVHGVVKLEDEDLFAVEVVEGERLSVEVEGIRLGRTFFDPVIEVLDTTGAVIARNDDQPAAYQDAFLSLLAPASGKLYVRLRESAFRGNNQASYLLHIGRFPRPEAVFPPAVVAGQEATLRWIGDAAGDLTQTVTVPADAAAPHHAEAADDGGVAPSTPPVALVGSPATHEVEPNNTNDTATAMAPAAPAAGVIQQPGDEDRFRLTANKNQVFDIRVRARELRSALDPVLRVYDAKGKRLAGNDDNRGDPDSYLRFKAPEKGEYVLQVEDRLGRGGDGYVYLLQSDPPRRVAEVKLDERRRYEATRLEVPQGGRTAALFTVTRKDLGGDLALLLKSLPPGVTAECFPLTANYNRVPVLLHAEAEAPLASSLSPVEVSPSKPSEGVLPIETRFDLQDWMVRGRNNVSVWSHYTHRVPVAVTKRLPFTITLAQPKAPLIRNGNIEFQVTAERDEGFDKAIRVYTLYHSPGVSSNRSRSIAQGKLDVTIPVTANDKARTGDWPMVVVGETNANGRVYVSSQFVTLRVVDPYFDLSVPTLTAKQGDAAEMVVPLSHRTPYTGAATLELVGLPPGVTAEPVEAAAGVESVTFALAIKPDAKPGRHRGVGVRVRIDVEGERAEYRQGYAELRIDPSADERTAQLPSASGGPAT